MPTLAWGTDLHLDFVSDEVIGQLAQALAKDGKDGVVLSGDLSHALALTAHLEKLAAAINVPIWFVLGNHDFYRGSIAGVRAQALHLTETSQSLRWLPACGAVDLGSGFGLVGVDGWGDGRVGTYMTSTVHLSDWSLIDEFRPLDRAGRLAFMRQLGDEAASVLRPSLFQALSLAERGVLVVTHVPPFLEACWHEGRISDDDWAPWFTCVAVGEVLREAARAHPEREILVVCGHTHGGGEVRISPNLRVLTGAADYGAPVPQRPLSL